MYNMCYLRMYVHMYTCQMTEFCGPAAALLEFILEDLRANFDLAIAWLFAEYSIAEGYHHSARSTLSYDSCLKGLLKGACEKLDPRDRSANREPCEWCVG